MGKDPEDLVALIKLLKAIVGDYWVVSGPVKDFLSPLDLRIHDILVDDYGYDEQQLVWKANASTFIEDLDEYPRHDRFTLLKTVIYLGILDKPVEGTVQQVLLSADAPRVLDAIMRQEKVSFSRLPPSLDENSSTADLRRALFGVARQKSQGSWSEAVVNPLEGRTREIVIEELDQEYFLQMFGDIALELSGELSITRMFNWISKPENIEELGIKEEEISKFREMVEQEQVEFRQQNPGYYRYRVFPEVALRSFVSIHEFLDLDAALASGSNNPTLKQLQTGRVDLLVTDWTTKPCFVVEYDGKHHDKPEQKEKDAITDKLLERAKIPVVRVRYESVEERKNRTNTVQFRLITSLLFEVHRRNLLLNDEKNRAQRNFMENLARKGPVSEGDEMDAEIYADVIVDEEMQWGANGPPIFDYSKSISNRAAKELLAIKEIDKGFEWQTRTLDASNQVELRATLPSRLRGQKELIYTRPLVKLGGNLENFNGINERVIKMLLLYSMLVELRAQVERDLEAGTFQSA